MNNNIGVIGIGRLGLTFALLCERVGYTVYGCDSRKDYINSLKNKSFATVEPGINEYLKKSQEFYPTTNLDQVITKCDIIYCFVATPSLPDGSYDHSSIDKVVEDLRTLAIDVDLSSKILVIGATVMPGYTKTVSSRLETTGVSVAYNPEFIAQGSILEGLKNADMILIGTDNPKTQVTLEGLYKSLMDKEPIFNKMSSTAAEITKISINCFLTTKIAFANMIGDIAISSDIEKEVSIILKAIGDDERIGHKFLNYGFGYGGVCLPRDNGALAIHAYNVEVTPLIPLNVQVMNNLHGKFLKKHYISKGDKDTPFIFKQLSYKKGVDILTESPQFKLCKDLLDEGYSVDITETPYIIEQVKEKLSQFSDKITYGGMIKGINIDI